MILIGLSSFAIFLKIPEVILTNFLLTMESLMIYKPNSRRIGNARFNWDE